MRIHYWEKILKFIQENNLFLLKIGRYELGDECFASVSEYESKSDENIVYEAHERYIDVQYLILGRELVWITEKENAVCIQAYDEKGDYALYKSEGSKPVLLPEGYFLVLFPNDLHAPGYSFIDKTKIKKIVFKIKMD